MPPRTRSGHAEKLEAQELLKSGRANVAGLAAVPTEILINIISHFSCIPVPSLGTEFFGRIPSEFLERLETLQELSQTCRRLRSVVLPILWEKIEVSVRRRYGEDWGFEKRLATELVRQLEIVTVRNPTLAPCVQEVSVCLSNYSMATVFPELVRALHMFPNMRALQIYGLSPSARDEIPNMFSGYTFPSVNLLTVTPPTVLLAKSFPQVKSYYTYERPISFDCQWDIITEHWKELTEIHGVVVPDKATLASIATKLPNLSYFEIEAESILRPDGFLDMVPLLQLLKNLQVIRLRVDHPATDEQCATAKANIASVLTKLQSTSSQKHRIIFNYGIYAGAVEKWFELTRTTVSQCDTPHLKKLWSIKHGLSGMLFPFG